MQLLVCFIAAGLFYYAYMGPFNRSTWDLVVFWMYNLLIIVPKLY